ncbi:hypothetical protein BK703_30350 [Bacillus thuringiensis serovar silo]|nr:hypothetical protein BK703_30350 [Bacillus thuringiensis serovar silo]OTW70096.1 hypothetical protein BK700_06230 [Bacillus thuringiensis serovar toguchini]
MFGPVDPVVPVGPVTPVGPVCNVIDGIGVKVGPINSGSNALAIKQVSNNGCFFHLLSFIHFPPK